MQRIIKINEKAYKLLESLRTGPEDSFSEVILQHVRVPAGTCGELLNAMEKLGVPPVNIGTIDRYIQARGRRSVRR